MWSYKLTDTQVTMTVLITIERVFACIAVSQIKYIIIISWKIYMTQRRIELLTLGYRPSALSDWATMPLKFYSQLCHINISWNFSKLGLQFRSHVNYKSYQLSLTTINNTHRCALDIHCGCEPKVNQCNLLEMCDHTNLRTLRSPLQF